MSLFAEVQRSAADLLLRALRDCHAAGEMRADMGAGTDTDAEDTGAASQLRPPLPSTVDFHSTHALTQLLASAAAPMPGVTRKRKKPAPDFSSRAVVKLAHECVANARRQKQQTKAAEKAVADSSTAPSSSPSSPSSDSSLLSSLLARWAGAVRARFQAQLQRMGLDAEEPEQEKAARAILRGMTVSTERGYINCTLREEARQQLIAAAASPFATGPTASAAAFSPSSPISASSAAAPSPEPLLTARQFHFLKRPEGQELLLSCCKEQSSRVHLRTGPSHFGHGLATWNPASAPGRYGRIRPSPV